MACDKQTLSDWVNSLPDGTDIGIDEGGLTLVADSGNWFEIGGIPDYGDDDSDADDDDEMTLAEYVKEYAKAVLPGQVPECK